MWELQVDRRRPCLLRSSRRMRTIAPKPHCARPKEPRLWPSFPGACDCQQLGVENGHPQLLLADLEIDLQGPPLGIGAPPVLGIASSGCLFDGFVGRGPGKLGPELGRSCTVMSRLFVCWAEVAVRRHQERFRRRDWLGHEGSVCRPSPRPDRIFTSLSYPWASYSGRTFAASPALTLAREVMGRWLGGDHWLWGPGPCGPGPKPRQAKQPFA